MRCIVLMFDSLSRHLLSTHGCDWTHTPNFKRLAQRTVTFDGSYVCSMPCMPARRDYLTGRANFLHRGWGPMEPFDDSFPELLGQAGIHTHMATDHYHYFSQSGGNYHTQFKTWEFFRGQEGEGWVGRCAPPACPTGDNFWPASRLGPRHHQDFHNRAAMTREEDMPQSRTVAAGIDFMRHNADQDNWFLHIETFDPHEPFFSPERYKALFPHHYDNYQGPHADWPPYRSVNPQEDTPEITEHVRHEYASLLAMCDAKLGQLLDAMDELDLWKDTMLIVWSDHGFLLGEHACWGKVWSPFYEEVSHTPCFVWDPRHPQAAGQRRRSLIQPSIDLAPTILDYFGLPATRDMTGRNLAPVIEHDKPVRDAAIFGIFGGQLNITDGRHAYYHSPIDWHCHQPDKYTLMPTTMRSPAELKMLAQFEIAPAFGFTKGCQLMKFAGAPDNPGGPATASHHPSRLYDLQADPMQTQPPIVDEQVTTRLLDQARAIMQALEAPAKQYQRYGLSVPADARQ